MQKCAIYQLNYHWSERNKKSHEDTEAATGGVR